MNLKNRQDFLVMLTIVAAGLFVSVNFVFTPLQNWWSERQTQVRQLREEVKDGNQLIKSEARVRNRWDAMRARSKRGAQNSELWASMADCSRRCNATCCCAPLQRSAARSHMFSALR